MIAAVERVTLGLALVVAHVTSFSAQSFEELGAKQQYFPAGTFADKHSDGSFLAGWYSSQLQAMGEPSLSAGPTDKHEVTYRFTWLRTFHHPLVARMTLTDTGTGTLRFKMADGRGGYDPGKLTMDQSYILTQAEVQHILYLLRRMDFWKSSAIDPNEHRGCDGSEWILEGRKRNIALLTGGRPRAARFATLGSIWCSTLPSWIFRSRISTETASLPGINLRAL